MEELEQPPTVRTSTNSLVSAGLWSLGVRGAGILISLAVGIVLARHLGPEQLGSYGVVIALVMLVSVVAQVGLPTLAVREISVANEYLQFPLLRGALFAFGGVVASLSCGLAAVLIVIVLVYPVLFGSDANIYILAAPLIPFYALTSLIAAEIRGLGGLVVGQSFDTLVRPTIFLALAVGLSTFAAFDSRLAILLSGVAAAITLIIGIIFLTRALPPDIHCQRSEFNLPSWKKAAVPLALIDYLGQIDGSYGILLVGILASDRSAGYFRLAFSMALFLAAPIAILHMIMAPTLARLSAAGDHRQTQKALSVSSATMFALMAFTYVIIAAEGRLAITLVFGAQYSDAWSTLMLLSLGYLISAFFGVGGILLGMSGGERQLTRALAISVTVSIIAAVPLGVTFGAEGVATASALGVAIQNLIIWRWLKRERQLDCSAMAILAGLGRLD